MRIIEKMKIHLQNLLISIKLFKIIRIHFFNIIISKISFKHNNVKNSFLLALVYYQMYYQMYHQTHHHTTTRSTTRRATKLQLPLLLFLLLSCISCIQYIKPPNKAHAAAAINIFPQHEAQEQFTIIGLLILYIYIYNIIKIL